MKSHTKRAISLTAVLVGVTTIIFGCLISIASRNPGGPPLPASLAGRAVQIAYAASALGAAIAIGIPILLRRR
ncbi:hypothetical protein LOC67_23625 [Stieleria sp. JC731]|uniref:hypothetical protein n=1 Tax=Pirellulaceae TaxID=2691357 RepID=UPI001E32B6C3|nr:hypothetical protein [Stieleria sp. JC731]MCC9603550.1 hypothetical protein [Stieleria sp. JC731]